MTKIIDSKIPEGPVAEKWTNYKAHQKLVNPANKRRLDIIVVGTGLAGASAAASLGEMGFKVFNFCIQDSPRRAHSIAAQGGINAAKNYQNDGDSVYRLFYDTVKGGDYRAREANVYRLAEVSNNIISMQPAPFSNPKTVGKSEYKSEYRDSLSAPVLNAQGSFPFPPHDLPRHFLILPMGC